MMRTLILVLAPCVAMALPTRLAAQSGPPTPVTDTDPDSPRPEPDVEQNEQPADEPSVADEPDVEQNEQPADEPSVADESSAADEPSAADDAVPAGLVPPELTEFVEAELPPEDVPEEAIGVTFEVTVGVDGHVEQVMLTEGVGAPYDTAATAAVERFRFRPATRDGTPIPARIGYRYVFEAAPPPPAVGQLTLFLRTPDDQPLGSIQVLLLTAEGVELAERESNAAGEVHFDALSAGAYDLLVLGDGYRQARYREQVVAGQETAVTYRLAQLSADDRDSADAALTFGATAVVDPPPREVTRRTLRREELTRVAGTRGDALRAIELFPGVARPPAGAGVLLIRGSAPNDSQTFVEGNPVPLLYHFGGLTGFVNSRLLERIDFYPGNFSVRYGRRVGGVVDIGMRDPASDGFHGVVDLNLIDASVILETPVTDDLSIAVGARRSYIDAFFGLIPFPDNINPVAAPVYWDYQFLATYKPSTRDRFRFRAYGSSDQLRLLFNEPVDGEPDLQGNLEVATWFHRIEADWRHRYSDSVEHIVSVSTGPTHLEFEIGGNANFNNDQVETQVRAEWKFGLGDNLKLRAGLDWFIAPFDIRYQGLNPGQSEGDPVAGPGGLQSGAAQDEVLIDTSVVYNRPAVYLEAEIQPTENLRIVPGVRVDYFSAIQSWTVDPRVAAIWSVEADTRIKLGAGLFSQPPQANESALGIGTPDLLPTRALHVSGGFEHDFAPGIRLGIEGFYKRLFDRVVLSDTGRDPIFNNDGTGTIYGLELSGRIEPRGRPIFGFLSYTLSRSERNDRDDPTRLFDFDQTHILNLAMGYRLGDGWEVSGTFRLASGSPNTPVLRGVYDANNDIYIPIVGAVNSRRDSTFHRLDLRVEKQWAFDDWSFALYLDVQNVYNRLNQEGLSFNYDFTEVETVSGLPIIPSLGVRGEF